MHACRSSGRADQAGERVALHSTGDGGRGALCEFESDALATAGGRSLAMATAASTAIIFASKIIVRTKIKETTKE